MNTTFDLTLFDNDANRRKAECMDAFEIMMDDQDNPLPLVWYTFFNGEAGAEIPWGTKVRVTLEVVNNE